MSSDYSTNSRVVVSLDFDIEDFILNMKKHEITHVIIDEQIQNPDILEKVFNNSEQNQNIKKIFDSKQQGYDYQIKIFEIK